MSYKLLNNEGGVRTVSSEEMATAIAIDATDPNTALNGVMQASSEATVLIDMHSSADGRGFSALAHLIASGREPAPAVWLTGDLLPDHITLAFQCGASAVLISNEQWVARGEQAWLDAMRPKVTLGYRSQVWPSVANISAYRQIKAGDRVKNN